MLKVLKRFSTYALFTALVISSISAYYAIVGLTAIFAAAVIPIIIMGAALEAGKLVAAVWLKLNWYRSPLSFKMYLVPAVAVLMALTSMGIFGFLSKAHSDQSLVSGDVQSKIAIYDEKIKIERENIANAQAVIKQMDAAVTGVIATGDQEVKLKDGSTRINSAAERSLQIRRSQARDRNKLTTEIEQAQSRIVKLQEESAPIRAEVRKVEAEVGPIKYIAALIYGDNPDANILEKAVRFVIIMIVIVFDPLALVLILAAQQSMRWEREEELKEKQEKEKEVNQLIKNVKENTPEPKKVEEPVGVTSEELNELIKEPEPVADPIVKEIQVQQEEVQEEIKQVKKEYLFKPFISFTGLTPVVNNKNDQEEVTFEEKQEEVITNIEPTADSTEPLERPGDYVTPPKIEKVEEVKEIETANVTSEIKMFHPSQEYVSYEGKATSMAALRNLRPDLILPPDGHVPNTFNYGENFPREALMGDLYMRVDTKPHRLFKFNGMEWMHVDKNQNTSYLSNVKYVSFLVDKLANNEYLPEMLTDSEEEEIKELLK